MPATGYAVADAARAPARPSLAATPAQGGSNPPSPQQTAVSGAAFAPAQNSTFLAQSLAQQDTAETAAAPSYGDGLRAYARQTQSAQDMAPAAEITHGTLPRLASGRSLDLTL
ncbi:MAG: hypothetical protein M0006_00150 [Magnetospirillum sp.]|nr:hypothetical protein [Magnetospirillum sp.]